MGDQIPDWGFPDGATTLKPARKANGDATQHAPETLLEHAFWITEAAVQTRLPYVVKGVFGKDQIIVFWGAPGSGKTFCAMELSCAIGCGAY